jgi:cryptochrome 2
LITLDDLFIHLVCYFVLIYAPSYALDPISLVRDDKIKNELLGLGISMQSFNGDLLYEPWEVYDKNGYAFTTFNTYWEKCMGLPIEISPSLAPWRLVPVPGSLWLLA